MKELTKKQKIKVLDLMIPKVDGIDGLCFIYTHALRKLNYCRIYGLCWTPGFKELDNKIKSEIKRTGGGAFIHYGGKDNWDDKKKWESGRLKLLKDLRKKIESK